MSITFSCDCYRPCSFWHLTRGRTQVDVRIGIGSMSVRGMGRPWRGAILSPIYWTKEKGISKVDYWVLYTCHVTLIHSLTHSHSLSHSLTQSLTLYFWLSLSVSLWLSPSVSLCPWISIRVSLSVFLSLSLSLPLPFGGLQASSHRLSVGSLMPFYWRWKDNFIEVIWRICFRRGSCISMRMCVCLSAGPTSFSFSPFVIVHDFATCFLIVWCNNAFCFTGNNWNEMKSYKYLKWNWFSCEYMLFQFVPNLSVASGSPQASM